MAMAMKNQGLSLLSLLTLVVLHTTVHADDPAILFPDEVLFRGQFLMDGENCYYHTHMQEDGNLVTYGGPTNHYVWDAGTQFCDPVCISMFKTDDLVIGCNTPTALFASMQEDGNFVVYNPYQAPMCWSNSQIRGGLNSFLVQQKDGNLVVNDRLAGPLWSSGRVKTILRGQCPSPRGVKTRVKVNENRAGGDYALQLIDINHWSQCGDLCSHDSRCRAWTYVPPGWADPNNAGCWLKDQVPAASDLAGVVSGVVIITP